MSRGTVVVVSVVVAVAVIVAVMLLWPSGPHVGDAAKLERTFTQQELDRIASKTVTLSELATANGEGGRQAWVAVNGVVYDVTAVDGWRRGRHHGIVAGTDATQKFVGSNHAVETLQRLPVVGGYRGGS